MSRSTRWPQPFRIRRRKTPLSCAEAREAISSRLDTERLPPSRASVDAHIAACEACARFEADAVALGLRVGLRAAKRAPDGLVAALVSAPRAVPRPGLVGAAQRRRYGSPGFGRFGRVRWAGATLPVLVASVAVSFGAGWHPRVVPTRPPSPCTAGLLAHHVPLGP